MIELSYERYGEAIQYVLCYERYGEAIQYATRVKKLGVNNFGLKYFRYLRNYSQAFVLSEERLSQSYIEALRSLSSTLTSQQAASLSQNRTCLQVPAVA